MTDKEAYEKVFDEFEWFLKGVGIRNPMHGILGILLFAGLIYFLFR